MNRTLALFFAATLAGCAQMPPPQPIPEPIEASRPASALTPVNAVPRAIAEPVIRVGLLSDQAEVTFPRVPDGYSIVSDSGPAILERGFTARAPLANASVRYAVQMASISDEGSARALADRIRTETGQQVDVIFDPASGQRRVLAGDFASSEEATPFRATLIDRGYGRDIIVVRRPSSQPFERAFEIIDDEGDRHTIRGESVRIMPVSAETLQIDNKQYRTAATLFVNPRGLFNVINVLNLEDYLQGVVPAELGPNIFDELEALKAQAVAARTYAVRNMGGFRSEGYDICPGPACQAYIGFSGEHKLSTQAVTETAGLVLTHGGEPIDALYTSTCGGETSDVSTMFPGRNEPYLRSVRCVEMEMVNIDGRADSSLLAETAASARMFSVMAGLPERPSSWSGRDVGRAVTAAARLLGAPAPARTAAASSRRSDVLRYLNETLDLASKARALTLPEDRQYWFTRSANPHDDAHLAAAFFIKYGIWPAQFIDRIDLSAAMPREELYALLASWLREHSALQEANGKIYKVDGREITLKAEGKLSSFTLPEEIPLFRRLQDRVQEYASLPVMIGDRATIFIDAQKRPIAMTVQANFDGAAFDRTSSFANWTRSYRADELVATINRRQPIQELRDLRPLVVDKARRIAQMEYVAEGGRTFTLSGLPIRWSLNVPDNLFVYEKTKDPDGVERYTFFGKGWGHGTGMCQVGAFGAAFRGWTFDRILKHYYTGVEIERLSN
jgi:stage II sporulation protein D